MKENEGFGAGLHKRNVTDPNAIADSAAQGSTISTAQPLAPHHVHTVCTIDGMSNKQSDRDTRADTSQF